MSARKPPLVPLSISKPLTRDCTRWLGDYDCGRPAVRHVIWDETMENGFVCVEHLPEVGSVWSFYAMHEVGPDYAMPGSEFFEEENVCRCPDELVAAPEFKSETAIHDRDGAPSPGASPGVVAGSAPSRVLFGREGVA